MRFPAFVFSETRGWRAGERGPQAQWCYSKLTSRVGVITM
jgi:hypothetical protein